MFRLDKVLRLLENQVLHNPNAGSQEDYDLNQGEVIVLFQDFSSFLFH